jgi:hypothetical protein
VPRARRSAALSVKSITQVSGAAVEKIIRIAQMTDKGCHTVNSLRKRVPVSGRFVLNDSDYEITD